MGILTDLIMATEAELAAVPKDKVPFNVLPGVDVKGMGLVAIAMLYAIMTGTEFDPGLADFPFVGEHPEDGPWANLLPDEFVRSLAQLDDPMLEDVAHQWAATEELRLENWSFEDVHSRLGEVRTLAQRAIQEGKPIYIWTCL